MEYTITLAKTEDLPDIVEIYNSTIEARQSTADLSPVGIETRKPWFEAHSGKRPLYVLKNHSGELLAWGSFSDYYPRPAFSHQRRNQYLCPTQYARGRRG